MINPEITNQNIQDRLGIDIVKKYIKERGGVAQWSARLTHNQ